MYLDGVKKTLLAAAAPSIGSAAVSRKRLRLRRNGTKGTRRSNATSARPNRNKTSYPAETPESYLRQPALYLPTCSASNSPVNAAIGFSHFLYASSENAGNPSK